MSETVTNGARGYAWSYDALYRLTNETMSGIAPTGSLGYGLDWVGNRTSRSSTFGNLAPQTFIYNNNDWLTNTDKYDSDGNTVTNVSNQPYFYDYEDRLTNFNNGQVILTYNADGQRVKKVAAGVTTLYLIDSLNPSGYPQVLEELGSSGTTNFYTYGLALISQRQPATSTNFFIADGHSSTRLLTDTGKKLLNAFTYDAYGNLIASNAAPQTAYLYCGEQFDQDLGFYYLRARYYGPQVARFMTMDGARGQNEQPTSLHKYIYSSDDPVNTCDPTGNEGVESILDTVISQYSLAPGEINVLKSRVARSKTIRSRSQAYAEYDRRLQEDEGAIPSLWFKAASLVTGRNALGAPGAFNFGLLGNDASDYLSRINEQLFVWNTANFLKLDQGQAIPGLEGFRGKRLDYGLVDFEQDKVETYTAAYFTGKSPSLKSKVISRINGLMGSGFGAEIVNQAYQDRFTDKGRTFSFDRKADRAALGDGIIDLLYNERD